MATVDVSVEAFRKYLSGVKSASTAKKYSTYTRNFLHLMSENGYTTFKQIPPGFLNTFASALSQEQKSASTVRVQVYAVKKYLEWVRGQGVKVTEQSRLELPKVEARVREILPPEQITEYFRQADLLLDEPVRTAAMLLPCSGLRGSEMVGLKLEDIHKASVKVKGKKRETLFIRVIGKGGKQRSVPLMEEGVEILTGYLAGWRRRQPGVWLFPSPFGGEGVKKGKKHVSDRYLRAAVQKLCAPLGLTFSPHTMRRTYITYLWRKGLDIATLAKVAGHANVQTTINHYIRMESNDALQAVHEAGGSLTE